MKVENQPAFVLRTRDYLETSLLVDIYSRDYGRLRLVAKGAKSGRSAKALKLQPFAELSLNWQGKSDLKTLSNVDAGSIALSKPDRLVAGMYLNELLFYLVTEMDPHPHLYSLYSQTLSLLQDSPNLELVLRHFEFGLLEELGYAIDFSQDTQGQPLSAEHRYLYYPDMGFVKENDPQNGLSGLAILDLAGKGLSTERALKAAKRICRAHIDLLLDGRELQSRKWYLKSSP